MSRWIPRRWKLGSYMLTSRSTALRRQCFNPCQWLQRLLQDLSRTAGQFSYRASGISGTGITTEYSFTGIFSSAVMSSHPRLGMVLCRLKLDWGLPHCTSADSSQFLAGDDSCFWDSNPSGSWVRIPSPALKGRPLATTILQIGAKMLFPFKGRR